MLSPHTHTPAPTARGWRTPTALLVGRQSGEGERLTSDAPHNGGRHPPRGTFFPHAHSELRRPARAHTVGPVLGPHAHTYRTRNTHVAEPRLLAPEDRRSGEGRRLTPDAPHNSKSLRPPWGTAPHHPRGTQLPQGVQAKPGRGAPGPDRPPPSTPDGARDWGRTRGGALITWNGPTSAQCQRGGGRTPWERERTHTQRARGDYPKGNQT